MSKTIFTALIVFFICFLPYLHSSHPQFQMSHLLTPGRLLADRALEPQKELNDTTQQNSEKLITGHFTFSPSKRKIKTKPFSTYCLHCPSLCPLQFLPSFLNFLLFFLSQPED